MYCREAQWRDLNQILHSQSNERLNHFCNFFGVDEVN